MDKRDLTHRDAAEELAALINMTRFMADTVDQFAPYPERLQEQLTRLEAELQTQLKHADGASGLARQAN